LPLFGALLMHFAFHAVLAKLAAETTHWTLLGLSAWLLSLLNYYLWLYLEGYAAVQQRGVLAQLLRSSPAWLLVPVSICVTGLLDLARRYWMWQTAPRAAQVLQEKYQLGDKRAQRRALAASDSRTIPLLALQSDGQYIEPTTDDVL